MTIKTCLRVMVCLAALGSLGVSRADDQPSTNSAANRSDIRSRLAKLQSKLDFLLANHQLTADQYQAESDRVKSLRLQTRVDGQQHDSMTDSDRDTDISLIRMIYQEANQLAAANVTTLPTSQDPTLSSLQVQYANLNSQYQNVDSQYGAAITAKDLSTAQALNTQLESLRQQSDDVRAKMQAQLALPAQPQ